MARVGGWDMAVMWTLDYSEDRTACGGRKRSCL